MSKARPPVWYTHTPGWAGSFRIHESQGDAFRYVDEIVQGWRAKAVEWPSVVIEIDMQDGSDRQVYGRVDPTSDGDASFLARWQILAQHGVPLPPHACPWGVPGASGALICCPEMGQQCAGCPQFGGAP